LGGVGTFGVVACVQEVTVTPGELLADADLIHYTMGASEKDEEEAIRKASDCRSQKQQLTQRRQEAKAQRGLRRNQNGMDGG
jgi:phage shock protein A